MFMSALKQILVIELSDFVTSHETLNHLAFIHLFFIFLFQDLWELKIGIASESVVALQECYKRYLRELQKKFFRQGLKFNQQAS